MEGRKEGRKKKEVFGATENRINETKTGKFRSGEDSGGVKLRTFEDNYRQADSILRSPVTLRRKARSFVDQSLSSKSQRDLFDVVAQEAAIRAP